MRAPGAGVRRWAHTRPAPPAGCAPLGPLRPPAAVFLHDDRVNQRFAIWQGDISTLEVDIITNTTDETLTESNPISDKIMNAAGPDMKEDIITRMYECRWGEVVATSAYGLRCRHVLHALCPPHAPAQRSAAHTALHNLYQNVLLRASEMNARSLALSVLTTPRRNWPPDLAAHIALRAIRRHLEQHAWPQLVIVTSENGAEISLWNALAALYFPRCPREQHYARWRLPPPTPTERRIRIIHNPHEHTADDDSAGCDDEAAVEAATLFADTQRLLPAPKLHSPRDQQNERYERLLRRACTEDLSEVSGIGCLYQSGVDRLGRPVVVFIGKWFPISDIDLNKALLYLIKLLDPIVRGDYVIAYFHTMASSANHPPFSWLKEVYTVLPYKYKKNLKAFYIVHPTFWTKMMTWWFTTFMAPAIKAKVHNLPGVEYLYSVMPRDQLDVPAFITEYDMTINGLHYFQPDTNNT